MQEGLGPLRTSGLAQGFDNGRGWTRAMTGTRAAGSWRDSGHGKQTLNRGWLLE
jgi:hypothetical protein